MMDPRKKNTLIGIAGGVFAACYSNAVRHEPMMKRFPMFHLSVVAGGAIAGYLVGCYEANALTRYDALLREYQERRVGLSTAAVDEH